tara:strand:- start:1089 stop:1451 length:363 start_codon:yes stop_codon:yes gene_type:complete
MSIHVTPIPRLTVLSTPAFTLGTSNVAGSAETAVASDSTLLVFDATVPVVIDAETTSSAAGAATVTARRDHVHGITLFSDTVPESLTNTTVAAATGDNAFASREDHVHGTRPGYFWKGVL